MVLQEPWAIRAMAPPSPPGQQSPQLRPYRHNLRPTLRAPQRYDGGEDERKIEQAGRSSTNVNAHTYAQSIREASRPASRDKTCSTNSSQRSSRRPNISPMVTDLPSPTEGSRLNSAAVSPYIPAVSSPLNPTPSNSSSTTGSRKNSYEVAVPASGQPSPPRSRRPGATPLVGTGTLPQTSVPQVLLRPPAMSQKESATSLTGLISPRSVRDLGFDYDRYYNPFATRNNSQQDISTPLPNYTPTEHPHLNTEVPPADLAKRLSNPFKDDKRASNPFESAESTTPGTPNLQSPATEREIGAVGVAALPARSGTPNFIGYADPEKVPFYPWVDDRLGAPCAFPLYSDQKEDDDDMHLPQWDDEKRYKPSWGDRFSKENIVNTIGMVFLLAGLLTIFVVLPVVSYTGTSLLDYTGETPLDQMPGYSNGSDPWAHVNDNLYPLLTGIRTGLIDPDTPASAQTRMSIDGEEMVLVFSDEFNAQNRTFYPGDDPYWFAPDIWYGATQDLEWYDPDAANTGDGTLQLQLDQFANHNLQYRSGMIQSWNQLCFKGGIFEVSVSLPGPAGIHGLWPGIWTMGNLGRPGYLATTDGLWPYTYDTCDTGITPNQSMTDGTSRLPGQRLPNCVCSGEDHPTPGTGRGAPEIDIIEVSADWAGKGYSVATQSFQVAPFDMFYYPNYDYMEIPNYNLSYVNTYTGGPYQQAISTTTMLNNEWYDGKQYQKYAFEYVPGGNESSFIAWTVGDNNEMMRFDARAVGPNGNIGQRLISEEPMAMVLNLGFSHSWVDVDFANLKFPTVMRIDYVRWYQKPGQEMVTCDPPGFETTEYIAKHPAAYNNPNYTHWEDAGYDWPKNTLMNGCSAD